VWCGGTEILAASNLSIRSALAYRTAHSELRLKYALARTQLTKRLPHLGGRRRAFYLFPMKSEQSGDVVAAATTNAVWHARIVGVRGALCASQQKSSARRGTSENCQEETYALHKSR
jgi:hypothetical protein